MSCVRVAERTWCVGGGPVESVESVTTRLPTLPPSLLSSPLLFSTPRTLSTPPHHPRTTHPTRVCSVGNRLAASERTSERMGETRVCGYLVWACDVVQSVHRGFFVILLASQGIETLTPLTPEVISRQATINIGRPPPCPPADSPFWYFFVSLDYPGHAKKKGIRRRILSRSPLTLTFFFLHCYCAL